MNARANSEWGALLTANVGMITLANIQPTHLTFSNVVSINLADGTVTKLPGYTTDQDAAETFWAAVQSEYQQYISWKRTFNK